MGSSDAERFSRYTLYLHSEDEVLSLTELMWWNVTQCSTYSSWRPDFIPAPPSNHHIESSPTFEMNGNARLLVFVKCSDYREPSRS